MRSLVVFRRLAVSAAVLASAPASADSLTDFLGPREIALGEAMRGSAIGQVGAELNPGGIPLNREVVFEGGYGYRSTDKASLVGVSACDSTGGIPGCFYYDYAGASPALNGDVTSEHSTHVAGMSLSHVLVPRILIGSTIKYYHFSSDLGEPDASGFAADFGATIRLANMINLGVSGQNLWTTHDSPEFPRALGGGLFARPFQSLSLGFDMKWNLDGADQKARYGGGAEFMLPLGDGQQGLPLRGGVLHDNGLDATYISGGLGYTTMTWGIDVGARHQIKGGDDNQIIASIRVYGPRFPAPPIE